MDDIDSDRDVTDSVNASDNDRPEDKEEPGDPNNKNSGKEATEGEFRTPKKVSKLSQIITAPTTTPTTNKYDALAGTSTDDSTNPPRSGKPTRTAGKQSRASLPPPIILKGKPSNHADLVNEIKKHIKGEFFIKYTRQNQEHSGSLLEMRNRSVQVYAKRNTMCGSTAATDALGARWR